MNTLVRRWRRWRFRRWEERYIERLSSPDRFDIFGD
jgi:hypothetical protein